MERRLHHYQTSIGRKQIVAATGLFLIFYLVVHLAGNLFLLFGPEVFNAYGAKLKSMGVALKVVEYLLFSVFIAHSYFTVMLVIGNAKARPVTYKIAPIKGQPALETLLMPITGAIILAFLIYHLIDFTYTAHHGPRSIVNGEDLGLYGLVYNSFSDPLHSTIYVIAMISVGCHVSHSIQGFCQTFGINHPDYTPKIKLFSHSLGVLLGWGFSMIPIFVLVKNLIE